MDLSSLPITCKAPIPDSYLDQMGHMNVMWYTHLFDKAVFGAFELVDLTLDYMHSNNAGGFALETHIRYLAEVRVGHDVIVQTRFLGRSEKRFHLLNFMTNSTNQNLAATFEVVGAHIDMAHRKMAAMPDNIQAKLDTLIKRHAQLDWDAPVCGTMRP